MEHGPTCRIPCARRRQVQSNSRHCWDASPGTVGTQVQIYFCRAVSYHTQQFGFFAAPGGAGWFNIRLRASVGLCLGIEGGWLGHT
jgi:hypothetical protein